MIESTKDTPSEDPVELLRPVCIWTGPGLCPVPGLELGGDQGGSKSLPWWAQG
jgi:hypothetical protein